MIKPTNNKSGRRKTIKVGESVYDPYNSMHFSLPLPPAFTGLPGAR